MPSKLQTVQPSTSKAKLGPVINMEAHNRVEKWLHSDLTLAIGGGDPQGNKPRYPRIRRLDGLQSRDEKSLLSLLGIELLFLGCPKLSLVTVLTTPFPLLEDHFLLFIFILQTSRHQLVLQFL
jgi:hypothetical protein